MAKPTRYVFVCGNTRPPGHPKGCCSDRGSGAVLEKFHEIRDREKLYETFRIISTSSCMGPCSAGPTVCVFPDDVWYGQVTPGDVEEIVNQHLKKGKPVKRLFIPKEAF